MKKNMGAVDKSIRLVLVILIAILYLTGVISGTLGVILSVLAVIFLVTSFFGFCPLYVPLGLSTNRKDKHTAE